MNSESNAPAPSRPWWKRIALPLVLALVLLGLFVSPWFTYAALGLWIGLILAGRGACPLGTCSLPPPRDE